MLKKLLVICFILALVLGCACAEEAEEDPILVTIGEGSIKVSDVKNTAGMLNYYGYTDSDTDYDFAISYCIQNLIIEDHFRKAGYLDVTPEEEESLRAQAKADWDELLQNYLSAYEGSTMEDALAACEELGYSEEYIYNQSVLSKAYQRLQDEFAAGFEYTEEDVQALFESEGQRYLDSFLNDAAMYEYYTNYYGYEIWCTPVGYRGITHILMKVDDDLLSAYTGAEDEETKAAAFDAVLASRQDAIDDIYARFNNGESFESLIAEYGEDPGMQNEANLANGYSVHADSIIYDSAFTKGAFQECMQKPGDISEPVVGSYGIHILYYLRDVPSGLIMTDSIHDQLISYMESTYVNDCYNEGIAEWEKGLEIIRNEEAIAALINDTEEAAD